MAKIVLKGWKQGMKKVSLAKLQMDLLNISLKISKSNVDLLLDNHPVVLEIKDEFLAREFLTRAEKIGVICQLGD